MRSLFFRTFAMSLIALSALARPVDAGDPLKPYVVLILDTSGSMDGSTSSGPPSCGGSDSKLNHAKCAINQIANSYGDMVLGLARFRETQTGSYSSSCTADCTMSGVNCSACDEATGAGCTSEMSADNLFELLTPLVDGNNHDTARWTDFSCQTCGTAMGSNPEIFETGSWTPIAGSLRGAKRYFAGQQASDATVIWPSDQLGFAPIANDPFNQVFLPSGEQCRPYIVISLTDGDETCTTFSNTAAAAADLQTTAVFVGGQLRTYKVRVKPIGFGKTPGDSEIEGLAHAGGATDVPGVNEGSYAQNQEELQLAISNIIAESVRSESCNESDDDCDALVDEDFLSKGTACNDGELGQCRGTGTMVCRADGTGTQCHITDPGAAPSAEVCDGVDNDCDGQIDEGACSGGCGDVELCNGRDDDCDMLVDEDLVRGCGTNVGQCSAGTETCVAGAWQGCTGTGPVDEVCDGADNDCDGVSDGFAEACSSLPGGNPEQGICRAGTRVCSSAGGGQMGPCLGEVLPRAESCNALDDDCDGIVDEGTGGADCSSACGVGTTVCVNGQLQCNANATTTDATCNAFDDDCDGRVDEDAPLGGPCDQGGTVCGGQSRCVGGQYQCVGGEPIRDEACDCSDNDCDAQVDEGASCPAGATCASCECAFACTSDEFPCPLGKTCKDGFCVTDRCFGVTCPFTQTGAKQVCVDGACVPMCSVAQCPSPLICKASTGECLPDDCRTYPDRCSAGELCVAGACVDDTCYGVSCAEGQHCSAGQCVGSCAGVACPRGQRCELGTCVADPCGRPCAPGTVCREDLGKCVSDTCAGRECSVGQWCDPAQGQCVTDPCNGVVCTGQGEVCRDGSCYLPSDLAGENQYIAPGGGGCSTGAPSGSWAWALVVALMLGRRRRPGARARRAMLWGVAAALMCAQLSCGLNDYCITCETAGAPLDGGDADGGQGDGGPGGDGGGDAGPCVPNGHESCDGKDNDCNGLVDDGALPGVGEACGSSVGECTVGTRVCQGGALRCSGQSPSPEQCDGKDNDCDGQIDDGDPGGGASCGTDLGECVAGTARCVGGALQCQGAIGVPGQVAESCDGRDNDCDGQFDEGLGDLGSCGTTDAGECSLGQRACQGGVEVCVGDVGPTFELCDALDQDCDGNPTNGYDLSSDARNCGACGVVCALPNAVATCSGGACAVGACRSSYYDNNGAAADGCEYGPCTYQSSHEACNQRDDDCDGQVDESLVNPPSCAQQGACAGATATCTPTGWQCSYGPDVSVDGAGVIIPEVTCDGIDNDCDGQVDESHPQKGAACGDDQLGVCRSSGSYTCNAMDPSGPLLCNLTTPGQPASPESCNALDDDCDGQADEGGQTGSLVGQEWVDLGSTEIMKYEASRPDATATGSGAADAIACSRPGVLPWTNVTHPQAQAACSAIGARLCSEQEWHRACSVVAATSYPVIEPSANNGQLFLEAEDYASRATGTAASVVRAWVPDTAPAGVSGIGALRASPNTGGSVARASADPQAPRLDYLVDFTTTGNHYVWLRMYGPNNNDDDVHVGINAALPGTATVSVDASSNTGWIWMRTAAINVPATGPRYVSVWMSTDGVKLDALVVTRSSSTTAPTVTLAGPGGTWAFATDPTTYQAGACNGDDYDTDAGTAGDQDDLLAAGALPSCHAAWGGAGSVFDLSGNAREWTAARTPGANPIRGGTSNNTATGISCSLAFTLASDTFFFPNVGFRCCR